MAAHVTPIPLNNTITSSTATTTSTSSSSAAAAAVAAAATATAAIDVKKMVRKDKEFLGELDSHAKGQYIQSIVCAPLVQLVQRARASEIIVS